MFSATSLVLRSRRSLISAAGTVSWIGTYINNPTNRAFFTPHSFVLRYFLSTTPDKDTSGSGSLEKSADLKKIKMTIKVGDNPINILPKISSVIQAPLSADFGTIASVKSSDTQSESLKPMDRDKKMAYLEEIIKNKDAALMSLSRKIESLADERRALLKLPESSRNGPLLKEIEEDVTDMKKDKARLVADVAKHETELNQLKHSKELADAPVPAQGI